MPVIIYAHSDKTQLSKHFNVQEFKCKCGKNHEIKIDADLVDKLEKLYTALGASKGIISSGYRCPEYDRSPKINGSGYGQHTTGKAVDICFYDKDGKPISSKLVSCKAQDIDFGGIANINKAYTHTHLDTRKGKKWKGNELKGYNTVTEDFYKYYGISRVNAKGKDEVRAFQKAALNDGYSLPSGADGIWGNECLAVAKKAICKRIKGKYENTNLVKIIQKKIGVEVDGKFGRKTETAVKEYQRKNKLTADGIVGVNTWKKILNIK